MKTPESAPISNDFENDKARAEEMAVAGDSTRTTEAIMKKAAKSPFYRLMKFMGFNRDWMLEAAGDQAEHEEELAGQIYDRRKEYETLIKDMRDEDLISFAKEEGEEIDRIASVARGRGKVSPTEHNKLYARTTALLEVLDARGVAIEE